MKQYIAGSLVASILAVLTTVCAPGALADEIKTRTWTGNGADNLWTNPDNWEPSEVSGASYDPETNTLTLEDFYGEAVYATGMGSGFTVKL